LYATQVSLGQLGQLGSPPGAGDAFDLRREICLAFSLLPFLAKASLTTLTTDTRLRKRSQQMPHAF